MSTNIFGVRARGLSIQWDAVPRVARRRRLDRVAVVGAMPVAAALACCAVAVAVPVQPGVGQAPATQPGVESAPPATEAAPPPPAEAAVEEPKAYWVAPPVEYDNVPTRPAPTYYYEQEPIAPAGVGQLHLPVAVEPVAPIEAPAARLRLGDYVADKPNWLSEADLDRTNNTAAAYEAQVNTVWRSVGVEASRADRIGAATIGGAAVGGLGAATAVGIPAAVAGGLIGGGIGAMGAGPAAIANGILVPGVGYVTGPVLSTAGGAAIGAAALGAPVAIAAGTAGAVGGAAAGMAFGAGDTLAAPVEIEIPDAPTVDPDVLTDVARTTVTRVESLPGGAAAVAAVRDVAEATPAQVTGVIEELRSTAEGRVGTGEALDRVEAAASAAVDAIGPASGPAGEVLGALVAGLA